MYREMEPRCKPHGLLGGFYITLCRVSLEFLVTHWVTSFTSFADLH